MPMPNFLIIGANKGGTTSLHDYLNQHPDIFMSSIKEPMFFTLKGQKIDQGNITHKNAVNTFDGYQALFKNVTTEKAIGESSTAYLHSPWCAKEIKSYIPDVKLIAVLRDPAERAYSNFKMYQRWGLEDLEWEQAVEEELKRIQNDHIKGRHYIRLGFYYKQIEPFYDLFGKDQLKIYLFEDFQKDSVAVVKDIFSYLNVDTSFTPDVSRKLNAAPSDSRNKIIDDLITKENTLKKILRPLIPLHLRQEISQKIKATNKANNYNKLYWKIRKVLVQTYKSDILQLQELIDRDLSHWLT